MAALPYMQLYVAEYLADTSHLNAAQHGAYMLLLMNYWQRGKALPDSNDRLAIVARMSNDEWTANREVLEEFFSIEDGAWFHGRVERDLLKVKGISNAGKTGGQASAKARKEKALNDRSTTVPTEPQRNVNQQNRTDTEQIQKQKKKKPSRVEPASDARHTLFKEMFCEYVTEATGLPPDWDARQAKALKTFLSANPKISVDHWKQILANRKNSEVVHGETLSAWISKARTFYNHPLDRFGKPQHGFVPKSSNPSPRVPSAKAVIDDLTAMKLKWEEERAN